MDKKIIGIAAIMGALGIVLGAFGAHGLKEQLEENQLTTFEIGIRYQMYHALFLLFVGAIPFIAPKIKKIILRLVVLGVVFFSGSLYLLATATIIGINTKAIGPVTPLGGLMLIAAWLVLFADIIGKKTE